MHEWVGSDRDKLCERLLVALRPPAAQRRRLACLSEALDLRGSPVAEDRLHVTLALLDDVPTAPKEVIERMAAACAAVATHAFDIVFDHLVSNGSNTCLLPSRKPAALSELGTALRVEMARTGLSMRNGWRFSPHVTLLYRGDQHFSRTIAPIGWRAESIVLIRSHVGLSRHETLGEWPLRDEPLLF